MENLDPLAPALYVVATPIGNLGDLTIRAKRTLESCDLILCEDTRHSVKLLQQFEINKELRSCHDHNEGHIAEGIAQSILDGKRIALISDAGTPAISDPGFRVVRQCHLLGVKVVPIPGASAVTAALSVAGLPTDQFHFLGFAPPKKASRVRLFQEHAESQSTLIFYESVHRIESFLRDLKVALGKERCICVGRELTKRFETISTGSIEAVEEKVLKASRKGEFVILISKSGYQLEK